MIKRKYFLLPFLVFPLFLVLKSCTNAHLDTLTGQLEPEPGEELTAGVAGTVYDPSVNAFNNAINGLSDDETTDFAVGNSFNRNNWVTAPSSTTLRDGLGPMLNAKSCSACHFLDGRGRPPIDGETESASLVFRLSIEGENAFGGPNPLPNYGDQLQPHAISGVDGEGEVEITYTEFPGTYPDGTAYSLRQPTYTFKNLKYGDFPAGFMFSPRVAPKMSGTGIFDALSDATILAYADPDDADGDGISGKPNYVWDYFKKQTVIGRIGWKSNVASVSNQVAHALLGDIGITSSVLPDENLWGIEKQMYDTLPNGGSPEISDTTISKIIFYTSALALPPRRDVKSQDVLYGKLLFTNIGCGKCHVPTSITSTHPIVSQLSNQTVHIYSDLLLHDMGDALGDGRPDGQATGNEWRTAPLWGLSYIKTVNKHTFLLHDGRARNAEEAILWHSGEAAEVKSKFVNLSKTDRDKILKFLDTL